MVAMVVATTVSVEISEEVHSGPKQRWKTCNRSGIKNWDRALAKLSNGDALMEQVLGGSPQRAMPTRYAKPSQDGRQCWRYYLRSHTTNWEMQLVTRIQFSGRMTYTPTSRNTQTTHRQYVGSGGIGAVSTLPGSALWGNIYFQCALRQRTHAANDGGTPHARLIHTLGFTDPQIQAALFGANSPEVGKLSGNITTQLNTDCFQGVKPAVLRCSAYTNEPFGDYCFETSPGFGPIMLSQLP